MHAIDSSDLSVIDSLIVIPPVYRNGCITCMCQ